MQPDNITTTGLVTDLNGDIVNPTQGQPPKKRTSLLRILLLNSNSIKGAVTYGVPHGYVLDPTLFLIYINDLGDGIKSTIRLFADDTVLYNTIKTATDSTQLPDDIRTLESWEGRWQMAFNEAKCHQLTVTKNRNEISTRYKLHLGVEITENLHWEKHIKQLQQRPTT